MEEEAAAAKKKMEQEAAKKKEFEEAAAAEKEKLEVEEAKGKEAAKKKQEEEAVSPESDAAACEQTAAQEATGAHAGADPRAAAQDFPPLPPPQDDHTPSAQTKGGGASQGELTKGVGDARVGEGEDHVSTEADGGCRDEEDDAGDSTPAESERVDASMDNEGERVNGGGGHGSDGKKKKKNAKKSKKK